MTERLIERLFTSHNNEDFTDAVCVRTTQQMHVIIDVDDFEFVASKRWAIQKGWNDTPYAVTSVCEKGRQRYVRLHRLLMQPPEGILVDHKNRNSLDNRRSNLRFCTRTENTRNRVKRMGKSKYKGVVLRYPAYPKKWAAVIQVNRKKIFLGLFRTDSEAALAYNKAASHYFGEFASLNTLIDTD